MAHVKTAPLTGFPGWRGASCSVDGEALVVTTSWQVPVALGQQFTLLAV